MLEHVVLIEQREHGAPPPASTAPPPAEAPAGALAKGGGAEPRSGGSYARAVVGGIGYGVGGWGEYEIGRRRERWAVSELRRPRSRGGGAEPCGGADDVRPGARYAGRTYVHAEDVVRDVLSAARAAVGGAAGRPSALQRAALRLADTLARMEDRLCEADEDGVWECGSPLALRAAAPPFALTIPPITSADLRAFAADSAQQDDPEDLEDLGDDVLALVAAAGAREGEALPSMPPLATKGRPPLPTRAVPVTDDEAVLRLEAAAAPYVTSVEQLQAALASRLDAAAAAIDASLRGAALGGAKKGAAAAPQPTAEPRTRGEEVDRASGEDPSQRLLAEGLPFADWEGAAFDVGADGGVARAGERLMDGVCYGEVTRRNKARTTALGPGALAWIAEVTSGRIYAWVYLDSPEAMYAVRAQSEGEIPRRVDAKELVTWIRAHLGGDPPHKMGREAYVAHIRELGFDVRVGRVRDEEVRFDLRAMTDPEERAATLGALRALTQADFDGMDWGEYDREAGARSCVELAEVAGDVTIDLARRRVSAPKVRRGTMWASSPHARSYVSFHTHPSGRYLGAKAEPPSSADLQFVLSLAASGLLAWHFVSAPEGTYILRPTRALAEWYSADPRAAGRNLVEAYEGADVSAVGPREGVRRTLALLADLGFFAYFHDAPCLRLREGPDLAARTNARNRGEYREQLEALAAVGGEVLLRADWSAVDRAATAATVAQNSWVSAAVQGVGGEGADLRVVPQDSHSFGDPYALQSYPVGVPGPLMICYFAEGGAPRALPQAAIEAARRGAGDWAWVAFLDAATVTVFRAGAAEVEVHGPRARAAEGRTSLEGHGPMPSSPVSEGGMASPKGDFDV